MALLLAGLGPSVAQAASLKSLCAKLLGHFESPLDTRNRAFQDFVIPFRKALETLDPNSPIGLELKLRNDIYEPSDTAFPPRSMEPAEWPLVVTVKDKTGGAFNSHLNLGVYASNPTRLQIYLQAVHYLHERLPRHQAVFDRKLLSDKILLWESEWQRKTSQKLALKMATSSSATFGGVLDYAVEAISISITQDIPAEDLRRTSIWLLEKIAAFIRDESLYGNPQFRDGYRDSESLKRQLEETPKPTPQLLLPRSVIA